MLIVNGYQTGSTEYNGKIIGIKRRKVSENNTVACETVYTVIMKNCVTIKEREMQCLNDGWHYLSFS
jgi:hypothetical protein